MIPYIILHSLCIYTRIYRTEPWLKAYVNKSIFMIKHNLCYTPCCFAFACLWFTEIIKEQTSNCYTVSLRYGIENWCQCYITMDENFVYMTDCWTEQLRQEIKLQAMIIVSTITDEISTFHTQVLWTVWVWRLVRPMWAALLTTGSEFNVFTFSTYVIVTSNISPVILIISTGCVAPTLKII